MYDTITSIMIELETKNNWFQENRIKYKKSRIIELN